MKKYFFAIVSVLFFITTCKDTNENMVQERGVYFIPQLTKVSPSYFLPEIEDSYVGFNLALSQGEALDKVQIEVVHKTKSAILREVTVPVGGVDVKVTAKEIHNALSLTDDDYNLGNVYYLYFITVQDGKPHRSTTKISLQVVCPFEPEMLVGTFDYESEDWEEEGGDLTFEADPKNPYKIYINGYPQSEGLSGNGNRIELNVNPNTLNITGPKTIIANNLAEWGLPNYLNYTFEPIRGKFDACTETYTIIFVISVNLGSWGENEFIFTKVK